MKAVIPVAGVGLKLRPHTHTQPKPLIPIAGKPILGHIIDSLVDAGFKELIFIVGYLREKIQDYVETRYHGRIKMEFVVQEPRLGLAHALWMASDCFKDSEEILVVLGDTIFGDEIVKISKMEGGVLGVQDVDDPREFGIAVLGEKKYVKSLIEKPVIPTSNLALVGLYKIDNSKLLKDILNEMVEEELPPSHEYQLTEALTRMIARGSQFRAMRVENWFDCGRRQSVLDANRIMLERIEELENYQFLNSVIIHPVQIAPGCHITDSIIGPYVAIAENAEIHNSIVQNSILGAYSTLERIILNNSVVGNDTTLKGKSTSVNIGDNTEIDFDE